jgi:phosphoglycerate kinase
MTLKNKIKKIPTTMNIKTLASAELKNKTVLIRVDFNVPMKNGTITENTRIVSSLPTIKHVLAAGAKKIHLLAHLGRPKGEINPNYTLAPVANKLENLLGETVFFAEKFSEKTGENKVILHENIRFYPGEKKNDPNLITEILEKTEAEIFVNDGFGVSHRAHASVVGFADKIPCYGGLLVQKEIEHLSPFLSQEKIPGLTIVVGGAKMETKVAVLKHFAKTAENICIGGALSNTFLAAEGYDMGDSLYEEAEFETARQVLMIAEQNKTGIHLPVDVMCAETTDGASLDFPIEDITGTLKAFDIGTHTIQSFEEILLHSKTVIWNGPLGLYEYEAFSQGTKRIANYLVDKCKAKTILGGGDTIDALKKFDVPQEKYTHISTGGGAMLEFLEGKELPGIKVLES